MKRPAVRSKGEARVVRAAMRRFAEWKLSNPAPWATIQRGEMWCSKKATELIRACDALHSRKSRRTRK